MKKALPVILYLLSAILLFAYSYTQVDLGLTLTVPSFLKTVQQAFQYVGYFERPLSATLYVSLLTLMFVLYGVVLVFVRKGITGWRQLLPGILALSVLLPFSYPAFSYDMFNYMFTAKTVLVYHKNPYAVIPLQFTGVEPWLAFMHWTHLPSAYTPLWIILSLFPFVLGFGKFLLIMWNIKLVLGVSYFITAWFIRKIMLNLDPKRADYAVAVFAFNPLVIAEALVSSHNDIAMMAIAMIAVYLYTVRRYWSSWLLLSLSVAMKLMTIFLVPLFLVRKMTRPFMLVMMTGGIVAVALQREILPWYALWIVPFAALAADDAVTIAVTGVTLGLLLRYAPYFYYGHWNSPVPQIIFWSALIPSVIAVVTAGCLLAWRKVQVPPRKR